MPSGQCDEPAECAQQPGHSRAYNRAWNRGEGLSDAGNVVGTSNPDGSGKVQGTRKPKLPKKSLLGAKNAALALERSLPLVTVTAPVPVLKPLIAWAKRNLIRLGAKNRTEKSDPTHKESQYRHSHRQVPPVRFA